MGFLDIMGNDSKVVLADPTNESRYRKKIKNEQTKPNQYCTDVRLIFEENAISKLWKLVKRRE